MRRWGEKREYITPTLKREEGVKKGNLVGWGCQGHGDPYISNIKFKFIVCSSHGTRIKRKGLAKLLKSKAARGTGRLGRAAPRTKSM
ncbi:hypothetical protein Tco_0891242 [Tanacetum coccineum]|uniref:Uncharacterized protein n=1 Tax=Tanacetum coccineum TaxID=301880 RepID=A0ABQ5C2N9_9ASTR